MEGEGSGREVEDLVAEYIDRLNLGERLNPDEIREAHPELAEDLLGHLEAFLDLEDDRERSGPLGTLGDFTLRRQIGRGGMGVVYEAWENSMDRRVALKVLPPGVAADQRAFLRFMREAKTAGQLSHPNVVSVYAMGVKEETPYYAMEYVEGDSLAQIVSRMRTAASGAPTPFGAARGEPAFYSNVAKAFADAADGLQHAHSRRIIHRDIKPSNLILERAGNGRDASSARLRILDFGLARLEGQESLSTSGDVVGTPLYMSPEQARRRRIPIDHRTDVYSLGATLYEVLTLEPPFRGRDPEDTLSRIVQREPRPPRQLDPRVPRPLETIVLKCLRKEPADRYGTAEALGQDLRRFARGDPVEATPPERWRRWARMARRRWKPLGAFGMLIALVVLGAALVVKRAEEETRRREAAYDERLLTAAAEIQFDAMALGAAESKATLLDPEGIFALFHQGLALPGQGASALEARLPALAEFAESVPWRPDAWFQRARALELLGRTGAAREDLARALACDPRFVPARVLLEKIQSEEIAKSRGVERVPTAEPPAATLKWARAWAEAERALASGAWRTAEESYGQLVSEGRPAYVGLEVEARLGRGHARLRSGDFLGAVEDLAYAKERWPSLLAPYLLLAEAYGRDGDRDGAQRILEEAHARTRDPRAAATWAAVLCRRHYDLETGLAWARRAESIRAEFWFLAHLGRREEQRRLAQRLLAANPEQAEGHLFLGLLESEEAMESGGTPEGKRRLSVAWDELSTAAAIDPEAWLVHGLLGRILLARGRLPEAKEELREQTRRSGRSPHAWFLVGWCYFREGLEAEAEEAYRGGLALGVRAADGLVSVGTLASLHPGRLAEAEDWLRQAVDANPLEAVPYEVLGQVLRKRGDPAAAAEELLRPLESRRQVSLDPSICRELSRTLLELDWSSAPDDLEDRLRRFEDASRMAPSPEASAALSVWRLRSKRWGDPERALEHAGRAAAGSTFEDPEILATLARAQAGAGMPLAAVRTLERGIRLPRADRRMEALLEECRRGALPRVASCASVDALVGRLGGDREALVRVLSEALGQPEAGRAAGEGAEATLVERYIEACLLELRGDAGAAMEALQALAEIPDPPPEAFARLARARLAAGRPEEALAALERGLLGAAGSHAAPWRRWAATALGDLRLSPAEALARLERLGRSGDPSAETHREDLVWLLRALAEGSPLRIDAGASEEPAECPGWSRDRFATGGYAPKPSFREIAATERPALYQTARFFGTEEIAPGYAIPIPPGSWRVALHLAETRGWRSGTRRFGVDCEGKRIFEELDPALEGASRAMVVSRSVEVTDGVLDLGFVAETGEPIVCGIEVERESR